MCFLTWNQEHFSDPIDTALQLNKFLLFTINIYKFRLLYDFKYVSLTKHMYCVMELCYARCSWTWRKLLWPTYFIILSPRCRNGGISRENWVSRWPEGWKSKSLPPKYEIVLLTTIVTPSTFFLLIIAVNKALLNKQRRSHPAVMICQLQPFSKFHILSHYLVLLLLWV
jgi:hypothetical protein